MQLLHLAYQAIALATVVAGYATPGFVKRDELDPCVQVRYAHSENTLSRTFPGNDQRTFQRRKQFLGRCCESNDPSCLAAYLFSHDHMPMVLEAERWMKKFSSGAQSSNAQLIKDYYDVAAVYELMSCVREQVQYTPATWRWTFENWMNVKGRACLAAVVPEEKKARDARREPYTNRYFFRCTVPQVLGLGSFVPCRDPGKPNTAPRR